MSGRAADYLLFTVGRAGGHVELFLDQSHVADHLRPLVEKFDDLVVNGIDALAPCDTCPRSALGAMGGRDQDDLGLIEALAGCQLVRRRRAGSATQVHRHDNHIAIVRKCDGLNGFGAGQIEGVAV